jgi:hypothetical protein
MTNPIWTEIDRHTRDAHALIHYLEKAQDEGASLDAKSAKNLMNLVKEELEWLLICIDNQAHAIKNKQDVLKRVEKEKLEAFKAMRKVMREYSE